MVALMPRSGAVPACEARPDLRFPTLSADRASNNIGRFSSVVVEPHLHISEIFRTDMSGAPQAALFTHSEEQGQRWMVRRLAQQLGRKRREYRAPGAIIAPERGLGRVDDLPSLQLRFCARAQRYGIHVRQEQQPACVLEFASARQLDNEVARLGRQRNALVRIIEADRARRNAGLPQSRNQLLADLRFPSGNALNGEKAQQPIDGGISVEFDHVGREAIFCRVG